MWMVKKDDRLDIDLIVLKNSRPVKDPRCFDMAAIINSQRGDADGTLVWIVEFKSFRKYRLEFRLNINKKQTWIL